MLYNKTTINKNVVLYCIVVFLFVAMLLICIDNTILYNNSWQNFATYDFERIVEKDENGEDKIIYGISTPNQLAGMFLHNAKVQAQDITNSSFNVSGGTIYRLTKDIDMSGKTDCICI